MRKLIIPSLLLTAALLSSCTQEEDVPAKPWAEMSVSERLESLEIQLARAQNAGDRKMKGDLKRGIESMLDQVEKNPSPEFNPVLNEAAESLVKFKYYKVASRAYEDLGQLPKAAEYAEQAGDMERVQELADKMEASKTSPAEGDTGDMRTRVGLDYLGKAEKLYERESKSYAVVNQEKSPVKTQEMLAKAVEQLKGASLSLEDYKRLFTLQMKAADTGSEEKKLIADANWTAPKGMSPEEHLNKTVELWSGLAADSSPVLAELYLGKVAATLGGNEAKLSPEQQKRFSQVRTEVAYTQGKFAEALAFAEKLYPGDEEKLALYRYAEKGGKSGSIRHNPFPFGAAEKSAEEVTYVDLFSPVMGRYVHGDYEERIEAAKAIETVEPDKSEDVKMRFTGKDDFLYLLMLSGGWNEGFKPMTYKKALQVGVSPKDPAIAFAGERSNFKYGQFVVHEVEWKNKEKKELARLAVDFLGSASGDMNDLCYGKVRYKSHVK